MTSRDVIEQTALGGELAAIRVEARLSQEGLAKLARISRNAVGEIERGITQPKLETLRALANAAATDGAGQLDHGKAQSYYERLTRAGKAAPEEPPSSPASVEELTDEDVKEELARRSGSEEVSIYMLAAADRWQDLPPRRLQFTWPDRLAREHGNRVVGDLDAPITDREAGRRHDPIIASRAGLTCRRLVRRRRGLAWWAVKHAPCSQRTFVGWPSPRRCR